LPIKSIAIHEAKNGAPMKKTWILVADEAIVRLLEADDRILKPVEELTDPDAHAKAAEMRNDAQGRRGNSVTSSAGEAELHQEAQRFAKQVAQRLAQLHQEGHFTSLKVVAAPRFLGYLRQAWSPQVAATISDELDKDLVKADLDELEKRLLPVHA
jgi:protein required for attachment to host cells